MFIYGYLGYLDSNFKIIMVKNVILLFSCQMSLNHLNKQVNTVMLLLQSCRNPLDNKMSSKRKITIIIFIRV